MNSTCNRLKQKVQNQLYEICILFLEKNHYENFVQDLENFLITARKITESKNLRIKICICWAEKNSKSFYHSHFNELNGTKYTFFVTEKYDDLQNNFLNLSWTKIALKYVCFVTPMFDTDLLCKPNDHTAGLMKFQKINLEYFENSAFTSRVFVKFLRKTFIANYFEEIFYLKRNLFKSFEEINSYFENKTPYSSKNDNFQLLNGFYELQEFNSNNYYMIHYYQHMI